MSCRTLRLERPEPEPAFETVQPPIYIIEVRQARRRRVARAVRALVVASSCIAAWFTGLAIGAL